MPEKLLCPIKMDGALIKVLSPRVGMIGIHQKIGHVVGEGTTIGELSSLGRRFALVVPKAGTIKSLGSSLSVGYGDTILSLEMTSFTSEPAIEDNATIDATMDGLLYLSPTPKSPPFVNVGDEIKPGQTIGLIEVMKCFYPMKYQGTNPTKILGVLIGNATPVTSGTKVYKVA